MQEIIYLIGPRASGKTSLGRKLALDLDYVFVDTDHWLEQKHGLEIAEIVKSAGWEEFRSQETESLQAVSVPGTVVSTGGGIVLAQKNCNFMHNRGLVFYLQAPAEVLAERLHCEPLSGQRPSLTGKPVAEEVAQILAEREHLYLQTAHQVLDATHSLEELSSQIEAYLHQQAGG